MPSLIPKTRPRAELGCSLEQLFTGSATEATTRRVLAYLSKVISDYSDGSFERVTRPNTITEQFYLLMPTVPAWETEEKLCEAILKHSRREMDDQAIRSVLEKFVEAHTFVYKEGVQDVKKGEIFSRPKGIDLFYLSSEPGGPAASGNAIQLWLFFLLNPGRKFTCTKL